MEVLHLAMRRALAAWGIVEGLVHLRLTLHIRSNTVAKGTVHWEKAAFRETNCEFSARRGLQSFEEGLGYICRVPYGEDYRKG
jgi:hypothetical protein